MAYGPVHAWAWLTLPTQAGMVAAAGFDNIRFSTVFQIVKGNPARTYPVFLMIATKD